MRRKISNALREQVAQRANNCCEYCLLPEDIALYPFEIDHIIAIRHAGETILENLAYCCSRCNRNKGTDLATILQEQNLLVRIFNPRLDVWEEHFYVLDGVIHPNSNIGEATIKLLNFNTSERVIGRKIWFQH
jgi:HNH endonuclease